MNESTIVTSNPQTLRAVMISDALVNSTCVGVQVDAIVTHKISLAAVFFNQTTHL
jgi:hypothetical protein